jgi:outer membrane receptor protein involved in Fe transport
MTILKNYILPVTLFAIAIIMFTFINPTSLFGQTATATIVGRALDEGGAVLPGVTITLTQSATGQKRTAVSDGTGSYHFLLLPVGEYELTAERAGFRKLVWRSIKLQVDQRANLDLTLKTGQTAETIEIRAGASLLQSEMAAAGTVVDRNKVLRLPLNGREFQQLALLVPGASPPAQGSSLSFRGGFNVAGARESANYFLLDGIDNNNSAANQYTFRPSIDMVEEFKVQTSSYSAEFGRGAGAQINLITRSGTNWYHGNVFEFLRNSALDAKNFFDLPGRTPPFKRNQFGATFGGPLTVPIIYQGRDRSFFFLSYEGLRLRQGVTRAASVPLQAMINGDFSSLLDRPAPIRIIDPQTRQPFAGNIIPQSRISPIGQAIARAFPAPNNPSDPVRNYVSTLSRPQDADQFSVRVDQRVSARTSFFVRYSINEDNQVDVFDALVGTLGANLPGYGRVDGQRTQSLSISFTQIINGRAVNEFRFGYNRLRQSRFPENPVDAIGKFGLTGLASEPRDYGFPAIRVTGFDPLGDSTQLPQGRSDNTFHFIDNLSLHRGAHTFKLGVDLRPFQSNNFNPIFARGDFRFTGLYTGFGLADLLLGLPAQTTRGQGDPVRGRRQKSYGVYAQEDWQVNQQLTLNIGLRYELNPPLTESHNRMSTFDPFTRTIIAAGQDGRGSRLYETDSNNLAPRFGFAWQPSRRTVIRGGYGVFYDLLIVGNEMGALFFNAPFRRTEVFNASLASPITLADPFPVRLLGAGALAPSGVQRDLKNSYLQHFSFGVQRELLPDLLLEASYIGSKGSKLIRTRNINQAVPGPGSIASRRPFPSFGNIAFRESSASSIYHSLQLRAEKRLARGLSFLSVYTWSKAIDDSSGVQSSTATSNNPQNSYDLRSERGLSEFDVRHRFVLSHIYELPFGQGRSFLTDGVASHILGGWELAGIVALQSGRPFTPRVSRDVSNTGQLQDRPNLIGNPKLSDPDPALWFNTDAFSIPSANAFGTAGRNILIGPPYGNIDLALARHFRFGEQRQIEFRTEVFNLLNHPNFDLPNATADSAQFGRIFSAGAARQIQFGLKIAF